MKQSNQTVIYTRTQFDNTVASLLKERGNDSLAVLGFIRKKIYHFHLNCDVCFVMNEVYFRGLKFINAGGVIQAPLPWIRATAYNVIREMSRQQKKVNVDSTLLDEISLADTVATVEPISSAEQPEWLILYSAFAELKPEEQKILKLRWVNRLSWKKVAQSLSQNGKPVQEGTARKRGGRALGRLRLKYKSMAREQADS